MNKKLDVFIETYQNEIINEGFWGGVGNVLKGNWTKKSKNNQLFKDIKTVLELYRFEPMLSSNDDEEEEIASNGWVKVEKYESKNNPDRPPKYFKIILKLSKNNKEKSISYSIKVLNYLTGKSVRIDNHNLNFELNFSKNEIKETLLDTLNQIPLSKEDYSEEAKEAKEALNPKEEPKQEEPKSEEPKQEEQEGQKQEGQKQEEQKPEEQKQEETERQTIKINLN